MDHKASRVLGPPGWAALLLASLLGWSSAPLGSPPAQAAGDSLTVTIRPRDVWPPGAVTDLVATPGAEGQLMLEWTAPDSNSDTFAQRTPATGYVLKIATFSADSVGSTTTWWNMAIDVTTVPVPGAPGARDLTLLQGLEPGSTFYAAIKSSDAVGNFSLIDTKTPVPTLQAYALVFDAVPPALAGLTVSAVSSSTISLAWTPPTMPDLWYYRVHVDSTPPYNFTNEYAIATASNSATFMHAGLTTGTSYFYYVTAVDKGSATYNGIPLEGPPSNIVDALTTTLIFRPMAPFGVGIQFTSATATLSWLPVRAFEDGEPFVDPAAPLPGELSGYHVYRATAAVRAPWTDMISLSTDTLSWVDTLSGPQFYYHVKSQNTSSLSAASMIRAQTGPAYLIAYDNLTMFQMPDSIATPSLNGGGQFDAAFLVTSSSHPEDLGGRVLKSVEFKANRAGVVWDPAKELTGMGLLQLHYDLANGQIVPGATGVAAAPQDLSVFWHNGVKYVQLYGTVDAANQVMMIETPYLGTYQLRAVERVGEFTFNPAGLSNKMLTPNGDGKNDAVVFTFDNPRESAVTGRIFDAKGHFVANMTQGPVANSLLWNGRSGGVVVGSGVYLYQIEAEGQKFSGTVVVIK